MKNASEHKVHLIKMIKEWNRKHSSYLSSFHIEVMALSYDNFYSNYPWHIYQFFEHMHKKIQSYLPSPSGLSGYVDDYLNYSDRLEASNRIETALGKTRDAWLAHYNNNDKESIEKFGKIFGDRFPSYG